MSPTMSQRAGADWGALEASDGVRMSWNVVANSRAEMTKCVVPFGAVVTPLREIASGGRAARAVRVRAVQGVRGGG